MIDNEKRFNESFEGINWEGLGTTSIEEASKSFRNELENNAIKKYSPLGTIVGIKGSLTKFMIIGFNSETDSEKKDYIACIYPIGINSESKLYSFNHEDIIAFYHIGYFDLKARALQEELNEKGKKI